MDIQLYQIDDENYLVDFRNLGYRLHPSAAKGKSVLDASLGLSPLSPISPNDTPAPPLERGRAGSMSTVADESDSGEPLPEARKVYLQPGGGTGVASPFLFLDVRPRVLNGADLADRVSAHRLARWGLLSLQREPVPPPLYIPVAAVPRPKPSLTHVQYTLKLLGRRPARTQPVLLDPAEDAPLRPATRSVGLGARRVRPLVPIVVRIDLVVGRRL